MPKPTNFTKIMIVIFIFIGLPMIYVIGKLIVKFIEW